MRIKITKSDVVNGSVYLAGSEIDLPGADAKACIDAGIAVVLPVSVETQAEPESAPAVDITELIPTKAGKSKGA